jgi:hypothetical protein
MWDSDPDANVKPDGNVDGHINTNSDRYGYIHAYTYGAVFAYTYSYVGNADANADVCSGRYPWAVGRSRPLSGRGH